MPRGYGARRSQRIGPSTGYAPKSFDSGIAESVEVTFNPESAETNVYTVNSGIAGPTQESWSVTFTGLPANGDYFSFENSSGSFFYVYFCDGGVDTPPGLGGTEVKIDFEFGTTPDSLASLVVIRLLGVANFQSATSAGPTATFINSSFDAVTDTALGTASNFTVTTLAQGYPGVVPDFGMIFFDAAGTGYYTYCTNEAGGSDPGAMSGASAPIHVTLAGGYSATQLAAALAAEIQNHFSGTTVFASSSGPDITVQNLANGDVTDGSAYGSLITRTSGSSGFDTGDYLPAGYFKIYDAGTSYYCWNNPGGASDPSAGDVSVQISYGPGASPSDIAADFSGVINALGFNCLVQSNVVTVTPTDVGPQTDAENFSVTNYSLRTTTQGSTNVDAAANTISIHSHGFIDGVRVRLTTNSTLPGGLFVLTNYFIIKVDANTLKLSLTNGGAAVDITSMGTGTQTITAF